MDSSSPSRSPLDPAAAAAMAAADACGSGLPRVRDLLLAAVSARPCTAGEAARAVDAALPGALDGREGGVHALLAELERDGAVEGEWRSAPGGRPRRVYEASGGAASHPAPASPAPPVPDLDGRARERLLRLAEAATRSVPGAFERESARAEVLAHLEETAGALAAMGLSPSAAARAAVDAFGDPWKVRTDLGRVHRGRPVVVYPRTFGEWVRAYAMYDMVPLCAVLAALLLVRWQVVQAYNIPTKSMEPTLHGDGDHPDYILVDKTAFRRGEPRRFDLAVFQPPAGADRPREGQAPSPFVKRCTGLGGEEIDILGGDLYADGRLARREQDLEDAMMVPLYDLARDLRDTASRARMRDPAGVFFEESWRPRTGAWSLRPGGLRAVPDAGGEARLAYLRDLQNEYDEPDGSPGSVNQVAPAGDLEVRFVATTSDPGAVVGADLTEGAGDAPERHRLRVGPDGVTLASGGRTWTRRTARFGPGGPVEIRLRNVDDRLTAWVDGEIVLRVDLPPRATIPEGPAPGGVELVAEGGEVGVEGVRILRDIVYLRAGVERWPRRIPEGKLLMMGDNTGNSHDGRVIGPVDRASLIGRPFAIAYPPSRAKTLR